MSLTTNGFGRCEKLFTMGKLTYQACRLRLLFSSTIKNEAPSLFSSVSMKLMLHVQCTCIFINAIRTMNKKTVNFTKLSTMHLKVNLQTP